MSIRDRISLLSENPDTETPYAAKENKSGVKSRISQLSEQPEEEEEDFWKSQARTALQIPQGIAEATGPGIAAGLFQLLAIGESDLDIDEWHKLRELSEQEDKEFDEEGYEQARQEMLGMIPTVSNIASKIEKETGLPLEPKTRGQKALRLGSSAYKFQQGTTGQKLTAGAAAPAVSQGLQEIGLPEVFADPLGLLGGIGVGAKGPKFDIGQAKKPSGLTTRQFEGITKPTEVPAKKIQQINDKLEKDFKGISDKIIKDSPIGETTKNLAEDPAFKQESRELLNQAQEIADATPGTLSSKSLKKEYADITSKNVKGYALGEYDKSYLKYMKEGLEDIVGENVTHGQLVEQYRKNNKGLSEYFEPGSSKALNRAKKDALLDQNRAIANLLEKSNPELSKVFKDGNQRWTKIMDAEAVDGFISEIFPEGGKINYKKAQDLFDKNGYDRIFKRALGDEGYKAFEQLTKDMLTSEAPYRMLRVAKEKGWGDFYKTASSYILHPKLGQAKLGLDLLRSGYKGIINAMLDKPKFSLTWKKAVQDLKKGDFAAAEKGFETLDKEVKTVKPEVLPKEEVKSSPKKEEPIEIKGKGTPKAEATEAFELYGMKDSVEYGIGIDEISGIEDIEPFLRREMPRRVVRIEEEFGKPFNEILKDIYGEDFNIPKSKPKSETIKEEPKQLEAPKKQIEHKEPVVEEDLEFRDRFMSKKNEAQSDRLDKMGKKTKESPKSEPKEKPKAKSPSKLAQEAAAKKGKSVDETIAEMGKKYPESKFAESKVNEVKRQDISKKGLKEQKAWLIEELDKAIEKAPEGHKDFGKKLNYRNPTELEISKSEQNIRSEKYELLTFNIPGDGTMKIRNNKKALEQFRKSVDKKWPTGVNPKKRL